jgi:rubrerythrin
MSDLISRQEAIDAIEITPFDDYGDYMRARELIEKLPFAKPVRYGKWMEIIEVNELGEPYQSGVYCSECGHTDCYEPNYCPDCGADMRGESE